MIFSYRIENLIFWSLPLSSIHWAYPRTWYGIGDVGGEHEIGLGIWHHGRGATFGHFQKNHIRKYFPAIFRRKNTKCVFYYCNQVAKWEK